MKHFCFLILYLFLSLSLSLNDAFADEALWEQYTSAGTTAYQRGDYREAIKQYEEALKEAEKFGEADLRYATTLNNLAYSYDAQRRYTEAEPLYRRALEIRRKTLDPWHPKLAESLENYAALLRDTGRSAEAAKMEARAKAIRAKSE